MSKRANFVRAQWRWTKRFFVLFPFWVGLIVAINIWHDASDGLPFNWSNLLVGLGILAWSGIVYFFSRLIHRFVLSGIESRERDQ